MSLKSERKMRYDKGRRFMSDVVIPAFMKNGLQYMNLKECGNVIAVIQCNSCNTRHFAGYNRCRSRWCVNCNHHKLLCWLARLLPIMEKWLAEGKYISMLNFTISDTESLVDGVDLLEKSFRAMNNMTQMRKYWKERFPGGIRSLECKIGKNSGEWHPHLHCMVLQDKYQKDFPKLRDKWDAYVKMYDTRDLKKHGSVFIKSVSSEGKYSLLESACEVLKYILKPEKQLFEPAYGQKLVEAFTSLRGKRQVNTWGLLRGLAAQVEDDVDKTEDDKLVNFVCQMCGCTKGTLLRLLADELGDEIIYDLAVCDKKKELV